MIKLLHTSDWQLGKQFGSIPGDAGAVLRERRIEMIRGLASLAAEHAVDAILVAGDVFDANAVSDRTVRQALNAMADFGGPWVLLPGNHDSALAASVWTRIKEFGCPENVWLALEEGEPLMLCGGRVAILPAVLRRKREIEDLTAWFGEAVTPDGAFRIGLAHGSVAEFLPGPAEAPNPIAMDRAERSRLDYLALGDWHGTLKVSDRCWYSGTPETDRFKSNDSGNSLLVEIESPGAPPRVSQLRTGRFRWSSRSVDLHGKEDVGSIDAALVALEGEPKDQLVELELRGAVDLETRVQVNNRCAEWDGRLHYLDVADDGLIAAPTEDDLDRIDTGGFVREAVERLKAKAEDPADPEAHVASAALVRLYAEHERLGE